MLKAYPWRAGGAFRKTAFLLVFCVLFLACSPRQAKPVRTSRAKGVYHVVKSGETLSSIARAYHIGMQELAEFNNIDNPDLIGVNRIIFVPDADQVIDDVMALTAVGKTESAAKPAAKGEVPQKAETVEEPVPPPLVQVEAAPAAGARQGATTIKIKPRRDVARLSAEGSQQAVSETSAVPKEIPPRTAVKRVEAVPKPAVQEAPPDPGRGTPAPSIERAPSPKTDPDAVRSEAESLRFDRKRFIWPVRGKVSSKFGIQPNGMYYNGITISARENLPVVAAGDGTVIFSGPLKDYGETVIMKHDDGYATVYTHLGQRRAKLDDHLKKGSPIGLTAEKKSEAQVVFEIRYKNKARNPLFFLP